MNTFKINYFQNKIREVIDELMNFLSDSKIITKKDFNILHFHLKKNVPTEVSSYFGVFSKNNLYLYIFKKNIMLKFTIHNKNIS